MKYSEINFDGLVGPTHNYAGLSHGNIASTGHKGLRSNPRAAALQGLEKAWSLARRGIPQAVLPPPERPAVRALRNWGLRGDSDEEVLAHAAREAPALLAAASSASAMWTANACTMTPSHDTGDGRVHFTPANLSAKLHRSLEAAFTRRVLGEIFGDEKRFVVHAPLHGGEGMADEGAANHTRLCRTCSAPGLHLFTYGRSALDTGLPAPAQFPARQTRESAEAIARRHTIPENQRLFLQQSPKAIDAGVFHNDVIAVGNGPVLLLHEDAWLDQPEALDKVRGAFESLADAPLQVLEVSRKEVSLAEAVRSYLFNSQLVTLPEGGMLLVAPAECEANPRIARLLQSYCHDAANPVVEVAYFDLRESMRNGGGPACLRQRIVLNPDEMRHLRGRVFLDETLYRDLKGWISTHYRDRLEPADLPDPRLLGEVRQALDALTNLLHLPGLYDFQK